MKIKEMIATALLAGTIANAGDVTLTEIVKDEGKAITRAEVCVSKPYNSHAFIFAEHSGDTEVYRMRLESRPLEKEYNGVKVQAGVAVQDLNVNGKDSQSIGPALAVSGTVNDISLFAVGRYYQTTKEIHSYAQAKKDNVSFDLLQSWKDSKGFVRYGLNIGLTDKLNLRLEGKHSGRYNELQKAYFGIGLQRRF